jgi:hypothetical protein
LIWIPRNDDDPHTPCTNVKAIVANAMPFRKRTGSPQRAQLPLPSVRKLFCPQGYPDKVRVRERGNKIGTSSWTVPSRVVSKVQTLTRSFRYRHVEDGCSKRPEVKKSSTRSRRPAARHSASSSSLYVSQSQSQPPEQPYASGLRYPMKYN